MEGELQRPTLGAREVKMLRNNLHKKLYPPIERRSLELYTR